MNWENLEGRICKAKPSIEEFELPYWCLKEDKHVDKGDLVEAYVRYWIRKIPNVNTNIEEIMYLINPEKKRYILERNTRNSVKCQYQGEKEFDDVFMLEDLVYFVEVKSNKLNGFQNSIKNYSTILDFIPEEQRGKIILFYNLKGKTNPKKNYFRTQFRSY